MNNYTSELMRVLDERGYIHQVTDAAGLDALAARQIVPGYIGFDATAPSLHIGSLVKHLLHAVRLERFHILHNGPLQHALMRDVVLDFHNLTNDLCDALLLYL